MQQDTVQQTFVLREDKQQFIEEISALRCLASEAGVAVNLIAELEVFEHEIEDLDSCAWERQEIRGLKRNELVRLSLEVLRAFNSRPC